jgi:hypothetical protein
MKIFCKYVVSQATERQELGKKTLGTRVIASIWEEDNVLWLMPPRMVCKDPVF